MTTMIERVARAICRASGKDPDDCIFGTASLMSRTSSSVMDGSTYQCHRRAWQDHEGHARAAVEAMRPLIDAMDQLLDDMGDDGLCVCPAAKEQARKAFEPFAALAEGETP